MFTCLLDKLKGLWRRDPSTLSADEFGRWAEGRACKFRKGEGFKILGRNFRVPAGEVDVIACQGEWIVFVEVKAERSSLGSPELKVTKDKQRRLSFAAKAYISKHRLDELPARFDVVTVCMGDGGQVVIEHELDAFQVK